MDPIAQMRAALVAARNADGGWPYFPGKVSRLEPTLFSILALGEDPLPILRRWPRRDGLFVDAAGEVNVAFNGQAAMLLAAGRDSLADDLKRALTAVRGERIPPSTINRQDNSIQAWSWTEGTFSWVEATAWCLIGVKRLARGSGDAALRARLDDGRRLLADRVCRDGGWNDGNSNMLGTELPAYVPTTAVALLALGKASGDPLVAPNLAYLERQRTAENGAMALALTRICLGVFGVPAADVDAALGAEWRRCAFLSNLHVTALALYALTQPPAGFEAFRV
jgi:hypothetical protein